MRLTCSRCLIFALALGTIGGSAMLKAQQPKSSSTLTVPDYTHTSWFPKFTDQFTSPMVPEPHMSNSDRLRGMIHDGKIQLSVEDAIALALENNLGIAVARYGPAFAQTDIVRSLSGSAPRGVQGAFTSAALFSGALGGGIGTFQAPSGAGAGGVTGGGGATNTGSVGAFDPIVGATFGWDHRYTPLGTNIINGVNVSATQTSSVTAFFAKRWLTGTSFSFSESGNRQSTNSLTSLFNPQVANSFTVGFNQPLLNGFGYRSNARYIRIARTNFSISESVFRQQVMTTITGILNMYWDVVTARENVQVAQSTLALAQKNLSDDQRQLQIGTLARLDVVRAESQVASDQTALIVAQTTLQQQEELLKTAIAKQVGPDLASATIVPTDHLPEPKLEDIPTLQEALKEAAQDRPEIEQAELNLRNQEVVIKANRNALLPTLDAFATYIGQGLAGDRIYRSPGFPPGPIISTVPGGITQSFTQIFHGDFPDYSVGLTLEIPLRNRSAQADAARAMLEDRQLRTQLQQTKNQISLDVRNAEIALIQAKAQIQSAHEAVVLAQQTLDDEQKKFQLGESTVFLVIQAQRDLTAAEGTEVQARSTYAKALVQFAQATGTILEKHKIVLNDALQGKISRLPNIPGSPN